MKVMLWTMLLTLIGCAPDPSKSAPSSLPLPDKPGVSLPIAYPVLMAGNKTFRVFDDEETLTTTRVSSGFYYGDMAMIDSGGDLFKTVRITGFSRSAVEGQTEPRQVKSDADRRGARKSRYWPRLSQRAHGGHPEDSGLQECPRADQGMPELGGLALGVADQGAYPGRYSFATTGPLCLQRGSAACGLVVLA
jgi:hypothetical protein